MAIVDAHPSYALNMQAEGFWWTGSREIGADEIVVRWSVLEAQYRGDLTFPGGQPSGTLEEYRFTHMGTRTEWSILGMEVDAEQFFDLFARGHWEAAKALALAGNDGLFGSNRNDVLLGYAGNDIFFDDPGKDSYDGGSGVDKVDYFAKSKFFTISATNNGTAIVDRINPADADTVTNVELLQFNDVTIDLRFLISARFATAAQHRDLLEMYVAYFDRAPDAYGIAYWASRLVDGMSLQDIAKSFFVQPETLATFPATMTTTQFVTQVYNNALGRAPDAAGLAYWVADLDSGNQTRDMFMLALIYGARAETGSPADAQYLANKGEVGKYFALAQGLGDVSWATQAMADVDGTSQSVAEAKALVDTFADRAETAAEAHLLLPFIGMLHEMPL